MSMASHQTIILVLIEKRANAFKNKIICPYRLTVRRLEDDQDDGGIVLCIQAYKNSRTDCKFAIAKEEGGRSTLKFKNASSEGEKSSDNYQNHSGWKIPKGSKQGQQVQNQNKIWDSPTDGWLNEYQRKHNQMRSNNYKSNQGNKDWSWYNSAWEDMDAQKMPSRNPIKESDFKFDAKKWNPRSVEDSADYVDGFQVHDNENFGWGKYDLESDFNNAWIRQDRLRYKNQSWGQDYDSSIWGDNSYQQDRNQKQQGGVNNRWNQREDRYAQNVSRRLDCNQNYTFKESDFKFDPKKWAPGTPKASQNKSINQWNNYKPSWEQHEEQDWQQDQKQIQQYGSAWDRNQKQFDPTNAWGYKEFNYADAEGNQWVELDRHADKVYQPNRKNYNQFKTFDPVEFQERDFHFDYSKWSDDQWNPEYITSLIDESARGHKMNNKKSLNASKSKKQDMQPSNSVWNLEKTQWDDDEAAETKMQQVYTSLKLDEEYASPGKEAYGPKQQSKKNNNSYKGVKSSNTQPSQNAWNWENRSWDNIMGGETKMQQAYPSFVPDETIDEEYASHEKEVYSPKNGKRQIKERINDWSREDNQNEQASQSAWNWENKSWDNIQRGETKMQQVYTSFVPDETVDEEYTSYQREASSPLQSKIPESQWDDKENAWQDNSNQGKFQGQNNFQVRELQESDFQNFDQSKWASEVQAPTYIIFIEEPQQDVIDSNDAQEQFDGFDNLQAAEDPFNFYNRAWEDLDNKHQGVQGNSRGQANLQSQSSSNYSKLNVQYENPVWNSNERSSAKGLTPLDFKSQYDRDQKDDSSWGQDGGKRSMSQEIQNPANQWIDSGQNSPGKSDSRVALWT